MADPWLKFYTSDWRSDPRLGMCSLAARGLWVEMICLMHEAESYGQLTIAGASPTDAQLAVLVGASPEQVSELIGELETAGVFSRTRAGVIFSRKLTRMAKQSAIARKNGKNGGNPSLRKKRENSPLDKPPLKPQKPEARSQNNNSYKYSSLLPDIGNDDYQNFLNQHPKPRDNENGRKAWLDAVANGINPEEIIAAGARYSEETTKYDTDKIKFSDNWLTGKCWERYPALKIVPTPTDAENLKFWASQINGAGFVAPSCITPSKARELIYAGLVTPDQMKLKGITA